MVVLGEPTVRVRELAELALLWQGLTADRELRAASCGPASWGCSEPPVTPVMPKGSLRRWAYVRAQVDAEPARHAKVYGEHFILVEMDENVFGASIEPNHCSSGYALGKALRQGKAQVAAALVDADEPMAAEHGLETRAHRLDLGEFRHCRVK